ncbi:MAG TPA: sigma-70 family RNA polymerase sigma factor [Actinomycetota bacterium]|jgi:RNA polymerase sigma factor (sigma-70 family)|nr:sigma-70 family RNA polymerase sigma factor [Actinomycetota bacterium]
MGQSRRKAQPYHLLWSVSDESLLAAMGSGDSEAAAAFLRRFQARVFGLALTVVRDRGTAEEVAQETFVRAWRHAAAYDSRRGRVSTWLLSITRNLAVDRIRTKRAQPIDPEVLMSMELPSTEPDPERAGMDAHESVRVHRALRTLPAEQRQALLLAAFYGRTAREIAELEDVPIGTVKTRIRTAMIKLRSQLEVTDDR